MKSWPIELFYLFFQGALLFQALVFGVVFFISYRRDILFYSLFLFTTAVYFFINAAYTFFQVPEEEVWNSNWYNYINTPVLMLANLFYLLFLQAFFSDLTKNIIVSRMFRILLWGMAGMFLFFIITINHSGNQFIYYLAKLIAVIPAVIVAYMILKQRLPFSGLVAAGIICNVAGTCITTWMDVLYSEGKGQSIFATSYPFFFIRLGLLADMILYMAAILKKWNYQEKQLAVEKLQSQLAIEKFRNKISTELHDDMGSTLSGVSMYTQMMTDALSSKNVEYAVSSARVVQQSVRDIISTLDDLVWSVNPLHDNTGQLFEKLEGYTRTMCAAKNITAIINFPVSSRVVAIPQEDRRNLYLICKEAVNNAVKYSDAKKIKLAITENNSGLEFTVQDDGKGFTIAEATGGNGLKNMQTHAAALGSTLHIQSGKDIGTTVFWCYVTE